MLKPTVIAIPIFALLIGLEAWYSHRRHANAYETRDAWTNIFVGFMSVAFGALFGIFVAVIYNAAYELAPYKFPAEAWWTGDLFSSTLRILSHRISHERAFELPRRSPLSEHYNLSVATGRAGSPAFCIGSYARSCCSVLPWMFALMHGFNPIYQFLIHTKFIRNSRLSMCSTRFATCIMALTIPISIKLRGAITDSFSILCPDRGTEAASSSRSTALTPWINTHGWEMWQAMVPRRVCLKAYIFGSPTWNGRTRTNPGTA